MARVIQVTPSELRNAATKIESLAGDYKSQYDLLYSETGAMATSWNGEDNLAFINQIDGFRDDFAHMYELMNQYVNFLRNSAQNYDDTQQAVISSAKQLTN